MHKYIKGFLIVIPVAFSLLSLSVVCYLWIKSQPQKIKIDEEVDLDQFDIYQKLKIFSDINEYDFYNDVRIVNSEAIIDSEMIAKIINFIISNAQIPYGDIKYSYHQNNLQELSLTFLWLPPINRTYLKINNPQQTRLIDSIINLRNRGPLLNNKKTFKYSYFLKLIN